MKKYSWFLAGLLLIGLLFMTSCGGEDVIKYENEKLGFSLEFPKSWDGKYLVEEDLDSNTVYFMHLANSPKYENGMIFSIERRIGELITREDMENSYIRESIIKQDKGYSFIEILPSDMQYDPKDVKISKEYNEMYDQLDQVIKSFKILDLNYPEAETEGYRKVGSSFFTFDIREDFIVKKSKDNSFMWEIYNNNKEDIGDIELVLYKGPEFEENGKNIVYIEDKQVYRKIKLALDKGYEEELAIIKDSFQILADYTTSIDGVYSFQQYLEAGGQKIRGRISEFKMEGFMPSEITIEKEDGEMVSYGAEFPQIVPIEKDYHYGLYGIYPIDENYLSENENIKERLFDFILDSRGKIKGLLEI